MAVSGINSRWRPSVSVDAATFGFVIGDQVPPHFMNPQQILVSYKVKRYYVPAKRAHIVAETLLT